MKLTYLLSSTIVAIIYGAVSNAQHATSALKSVQIVRPDLYQFTMSPFSNVPAECTRLNQLIAEYSLNKCDTDRGTRFCDSIIAKIGISQVLDFENANSMDKSGQTYRVVPLTNVPDQTVFSKRFDVAYISGYNFSLSSLDTPKAFRFEGAMTSAELSAAAKLNIDAGFKLKQFQGEKLLQVDSIITACALEGGRISLVGTAKLNVSSYHPVGKVAYEIAEQTYKKSKLLFALEDLTDQQRSYRLGLLMGEELTKMSDFIGSASELIEVARSLRFVLMDNAEPKLCLKPQQDGAGLGARLLDPGFEVTDATVKIVFKGEQGD